MYSTDDDLFSNRRKPAVQWRHSIEKKDTNTHEVKRVPSEDSSDDLATERDPLWRKQMESRSFDSPRALSHPNVATATSESKSKDLTALSAASRLETPRSVVSKRKQGGVQLQKDNKQKKENAGDDLCMHSNHVERKPRKLLERSSKRSPPSTPRKESRSPTRTWRSLICGGRASPDRSIVKTSKEKPIHGTRDKDWQSPSPDRRLVTERGHREWQDHFDCSLETTADTIKSHLSHRLDSTDERLEKLSSLLGKHQETDKNLDVVDELKTFIDGQLRRGMEKAVSSAIMELNDRMRSEAENANEKIELLMKGLMESYALISRKVEDLTAASKEGGQSMSRRGCSRESCPRSSQPRGSSVDRNERIRPKTASGRSINGVGSGVPHQGSSPREVAKLRRDVDELEEKTKQCWFEIVDVRDAQLRRHQRTRYQLNKLTQECAENRSAMESKDVFIREQIATLSRQLTAVEDFIAIIEKSRKRSNVKKPEIEAYVTQIYDACKSTLKNVDDRYRKLRQCYREVKENQVTVEGKCDALAESLSNLCRKTTSGKERSRNHKAT